MRGGPLAYPVNWWLVATGLKHGTGSSRALDKGGHEPAHDPAQARPPARAEAAVAVATIAMLAIGVGLAATVADLSMHAGA